MKKFGITGEKIPILKSKILLISQRYQHSQHHNGTNFYSRLKTHLWSWPDFKFF